MRWSFTPLVAALFALMIPNHASAADPPPMASELLQPHLIRLKDGRRINIHCIGKGAPAVLFEQGGEGMIFNWAKVQPAITALTRTCFYDRGGFGWSDPPRYPVTALSVTDDLAAVLARARIKGPIVLVGHSVGGFYATVFADRFGAQVAGLVLVDPGFAGQDLAPSIQVAGMNRRGEGRLVRCAALARIGALTADNLADRQCFPIPPDAETSEARQYVLNAITRPHWYEAEHSQSVNYFTGDDRLSVSHQQAKDVARPLGELPILVLSMDRANRPPWRSEDEHLASFGKWRAGHAELAARSTRGRMTVVPGAGHFIQKDRPEAVIAAIREVVETVRRETQ